VLPDEEIIQTTLKGEQEQGSKTVLSVIRPAVAMQMIDNVELQKLADAVEGQLKKAFDAVK